MLWVATAAFAIGQGIAGTAWQATPPHDQRAGLVAGAHQRSTGQDGRASRVGRGLPTARAAALSGDPDRISRPAGSSARRQTHCARREYLSLSPIGHCSGWKPESALRRHARVHGARESGRVCLRPLGPANLAREFRATRGGPHPRGPAHARARRESAIVGRDHREGPAALQSVKKRPALTHDEKSSWRDSAPRRIPCPEWQ